MRQEYRIYMRVHPCDVFIGGRGRILERRSHPQLAPADGTGGEHGELWLLPQHQHGVLGQATSADVEPHRHALASELNTCTQGGGITLLDI